MISWFTIGYMILIDVIVAGYYNFMSKSKTYDSTLGKNNKIPSFSNVFNAISKRFKIT